ncbi:2-phospho-L-lactate transferase [Aeromicrobium fastidiosum]|uniref:2-phospho-L-lactate transferase n=2 Tax=Aeromicrobium fastidiosum TaxID=52699 RepID=A0A641ASD8_9ACTN|nr:2-phospho-L-lactate transferase [Aeromicrobium fastidiosum]KAA1380879.1 2-phospho-L-lactate transferase [Aeromicrobium fastidiosum]MBP2389447.1 LPPG:FO 2-phospho-L-lactate transferase [Aeromicrobium fastidiosum]
MHITVLSGGVGGSRFIEGLLRVKDPDDDVTVIVNTADDISLFGLRISPDLDTVMYTLGDGIDRERGWGRTDESWNAKDELGAYGVAEAWFGLGDRDIATHLLRTMRLQQGRTLTEVTAELCERWRPGVSLLPMSDDRVETHIGIDRDGVRELIHFQEYWIRLRASVPVEEVVVQGVLDATPAPGVVEAIVGADVVLLPPSNPIVSIGPIVAVAGIRDALATTTAPVVGVSPIIGTGAVRGMADQLLTGLGIDLSAAGVAAHHGHRESGGVLDGWLIDSSDDVQLATIDALGVTCRAVPLWMTDEPATDQLVRDTMALALHIGTRR